MRADANTTRALIDDDPLLPATPHQQAHVTAWCNQRHDGRLVLGPAAAVNLKARPLGPRAQVITQLPDSLRNYRYADLEQQLYACPQGRDAAYVERAAFPAAG